MQSQTAIHASVPRDPRRPVVGTTRRRPPVSIRSWGICSPLADTPEGIADLLLNDTAASFAGRRAFYLQDLHGVSGLGMREAKKVDRFSLLAVAAARQTLGQARLLPDELMRCGIITGNMMAGWTFTEPQLRTLHQSSPTEVSPYLATAWFPAAPQGQVSIQLQIKGLAKTVTTDRCAGAQAIGLAFHFIRNGKCDLLLAGGAEAPLTPFIEAAFTEQLGGHAPLAEAAAYLLLSRGKGGLATV